MSIRRRRCRRGHRNDRKPCQGLEDAFTSVRRGGCVVLVGGFREPLSLDLKRVVDNEIGYSVHSAIAPAA